MIQKCVWNFFMKQQDLFSQRLSKWTWIPCPKIKSSGDFKALSAFLVIFHHKKNIFHHQLILNWSILSLKLIRNRWKRRKYKLTYSIDAFIPSFITQIVCKSNSNDIQWCLLFLSYQQHTFSLSSWIKLSLTGIISSLLQLLNYHIHIFMKLSSSNERLYDVWGKMIFTLPFDHHHHLKLSTHSLCEVYSLTIYS